MIKTLFEMLNNGKEVAKNHLQTLLTAMHYQDHWFWEDIFRKYDPNNTYTLTFGEFKKIFD